MFETTFIALSTGTAEVMVVAQFVGGGAAFDLVEDGGVDGDRRVGAAGAGGPHGLAGRQGWGNARFFGGGGGGF